MDGGYKFSYTSYQEIDSDSARDWCGDPWSQACVKTGNDMRSVGLGV